MNDYILDDYFDWLYFYVTSNLRRHKKHYRKLMKLLHSMEYYYYIDYDENRASDGINMRWYYVDDGGDADIMSYDTPCSVLEMLIGLAIKMDSLVDAEDGPNTWFWMMLENLDLDNQTDRNFDADYVTERVNVFLDRIYEPDGNGNIIYIPNFDEDLRTMEIWMQMCLYLDTQI